DSQTGRQRRHAHAAPGCPGQAAPGPHHTGRGREGDARAMSIHYFDYQACDAEGKLTSGQLGAESEREAVAQLQARKLVPIRVRPAARQSSSRRGGGISNADLVDFTNGLCTLVEA